MADTAAERERRDEQIRETIMAKLVETGIKESYYYLIMLCYYLIITIINIKVKRIN